MAVQIQQSITLSDRCSHFLIPTQLAFKGDVLVGECSVNTSRLLKFGAVSRQQVFRSLEDSFILFGSNNMQTAVTRLFLLRSIAGAVLRSM